MADENNNKNYDNMNENTLLSEDQIKTINLSEDLEQSGYIIYENISDSIYEIYTAMSKMTLRRYRSKNRKESKLFKLKNFPNIFFIENIKKWFCTDDTEQGISVNCYDFLNEIQKTNNVKNNEKIETDNFYENLNLKGYILFDYINFNKIIADSFISEHDIMTSTGKLKFNQSKLYSLIENENIFYILELEKWFYSPSKILEDTKILLYNKYEDIPINDCIKQNEIDQIDSTHYQQIKLKHDELKKKRMNSMMRTFNFEQYILYEFIENDKIRIIQKSDDKENLIENKNVFQQISKVFNKKNNENVKFIRAIRKWFYISDETDDSIIELYDNYDNLDIPEDKKVENKQVINTEKNNNLIFKGWIFYKNIENNKIVAKEYLSSNELYKRLDNEKGNTSEVFLCKDNKEFKYIKELNKYYKVNNKLKNMDITLNLYDDAK